MTTETSQTDKPVRKVNGIEITSNQFAYDGCHKIYLINSKEDQQEAEETNYELCPIEELQAAYEKSCGLQFINNWDLTSVVRQFEKAQFDGFASVD
jgi:hypothetical protein